MYDLAGIEDSYKDYVIDEIPITVTKVDAVPITITTIYWRT